MAKDEDMDTDEVYNGEGREEMMRNDEISPEEEAFMKGYDEDMDEEEADSGDLAYEESFAEKTKKPKRK
ncbi:MAG: hypothetical protein KKG59_03875 [Nanoarchaeota archaeon]|nr:hypothetical protein [Nanoarchaeota archaeon]